MILFQLHEKPVGEVKQALIFPLYIHVVDSGSGVLSYPARKWDTGLKLQEMANVQEKTRAQLRVLALVFIRIRRLTNMVIDIHKETMKL